MMVNQLLAGVHIAAAGEAMALAGNFQESLGKAMRSIDKRHMGFNWDGDKPSAQEVDELLECIGVQPVS